MEISETAHERERKEGRNLPFLGIYKGGRSNPNETSFNPTPLKEGRVFRPKFFGAHVLNTVSN